MQDILGWVPIVANACAALCWLRSGIVKTPIRYSTSGMTFATAASKNEPPKLDPIVVAMRLQSRWSAAGAAFACVAAAFQVFYH